MKRILVFGMTENPGGVESFIMSYYRNIDREQMQFDFLCNSHNKIAYEDEVLSMGARTFHIAQRRQNPLKFRKELHAFFEEHASEFDAIWVNVSSLANIDYLKEAKKYGIKRRIIHSHNTMNMDSGLRGWVHNRNRKIIDHYATDFWACSEEAAKWFYEDSLMKDVKIIPNAIDIERYCYSSEKRSQLRKEYNMTENYVIGNVGRLHFQKNQKFLIDRFAELSENNPNYRLVLVGQGEDEAVLKQQVERLGLTESVLFAGVQSDIQAWLSMFDVYLFPSLFEGLPVAALEAQANGVPVIASSKALPASGIMNSNVRILNLEDSNETWVRVISEASTDMKREPEQMIREHFVRHGYEIKEAAVLLQEELLRGSDE